MMKIRRSARFANRCRQQPLLVWGQAGASMLPPGGIRIAFRRLRQMDQLEEQTRDRKGLDCKMIHARG
ncbi:MAG: hypothetical protein PVG41_15965, partial [Desulfobacteraceae bacterium]